MKLIPPRTYASDLDDDELILFDFLWAGDAPEALLFADKFSMHANTPYAHLIANDQRRSRFLALVGRNLLCSSTTAPTGGNLRWSQPCFGSTKQGLAVWESERLPDWSRYVHDSWGDDELTVTAVSKHIGFHFIEACRQSGVWNITATEPTHRIEKNVELFCGKTFSGIHHFSVPTTLDDSTITNWPLYESNRVWWRRCSELWQPGLPSP